MPSGSALRRGPGDLEPLDEVTKGFVLHVSGGIGVDAMGRLHMTHVSPFKGILEWFRTGTETWGGVGELKDRGR